MAATMTETEMRALIYNEVTSGNTCQALNDSVKVLINDTHANFAETLKAFEITAGRISVQEREGKKMNDEIQRILGDCQTFVALTKTELTASRTEMTQQLEAVHAQQQAFRTFVDGLPTTEVVDALTTKLNAIDDWCNVNSLATVPAR